MALNGLIKNLFVAVIVAATFSFGCKARREMLPTAPAIVQALAITSKCLESGITDTLSFGRMRSGEVVRKRLTLKNETQQPMVILRHVNTCGCTKLNYDRKPIAAGAESAIDFEFDSKGQSGWQMKLIELYLANSDQKIKIYIEAEVE